MKQQRYCQMCRTKLTPKEKRGNNYCIHCLIDNPFGLKIETPKKEKVNKFKLIEETMAELETPVKETEETEEV